MHEATSWNDRDILKHLALYSLTHSKEIPGSYNKWKVNGLEKGNVKPQNRQRSTRSEKETISDEIDRSSDDSEVVEDDGEVLYGYNEEERKDTKEDEILLQMVADGETGNSERFQDQLLRDGVIVGNIIDAYKEVFSEQNEDVELVINDEPTAQEVKGTESMDDTKVMGDEKMFESGSVLNGEDVRGKCDDLAEEKLHLDYFHITGDSKRI